MSLQQKLSRYWTPIIVFLPTSLFCLYALFFAKPTYETETNLIVRENQGGAGSVLPGFATALLGLGGSTSLEDSMILESYLQSAAFIEFADAELGLRLHFKTAPLDPIRRLDQDAEAEVFHRYFRKKVKVRVSTESGILTVQVRTFDPALTVGLADLIIARSEEVINKLNERMVLSQTSLAKQELQKNEARLQASRAALLAFQRDNAIVDPVSESIAQIGNIATLDSRLVEKRAELKAKSSYLRDDAFELRVLQQEIAALEEQRGEETRHMVSADDDSMVMILQGYERLKIEHEFAINAYTVALAMLESAVVEASRQEKFLLVIGKPHMPEEPVSPRPIRDTATVFVLSAAALGIVRLVVATIRDHSI